MALISSNLVNKTYASADSTDLVDTIVVASFEGVLVLVPAFICVGINITIRNAEIVHKINFFIFEVLDVNEFVLQRSATLTGEMLHNFDKILHYSHIFNY